MRPAIRCRRDRVGERGAVAVELALLSPVLMFMIIAAIDFGMAVDRNMRLHGAARAGAQFAIQNETNIDDSAGIANAVQAATGLTIDDGDITINDYYACADDLSTTYEFSNLTGPVCNNNTSYPGYYVTVTVTNTFAPLFPWPGIDDPMGLTGTATMRLY